MESCYVEPRMCDLQVSQKTRQLIVRGEAGRFFQSAGTAAATAGHAGMGDGYRLLFGPQARPSRRGAGVPANGRAGIFFAAVVDDVLAGCHVKHETRGIAPPS